MINILNHHFCKLHCYLIIIFIHTALCYSAEESAPFQKDEVGYKKNIVPFLNQYCEKCHNSKKEEGEFNITNDLSANVLDPATKAKWGELINVLNSHEMPPEKEKQPSAQDVAKVVDWVTAEMSRAELFKRETSIVLRRLNKSEYKNTIRDLTGVDFDVSGFPQDPPASGFDNIGKALTLSPLHVELYFDSAQKILNEAIPTGSQPESIKWKFEVETGDAGDKTRQRIDKQNNPIVNGGKNRSENGYKVMHHESWDRKLNVRDFRVPTKGPYIIRVRAGGKVPSRSEVVESAKKILQQRMDRELAKNPKGEKYIRDQFNNDLAHFEKHPMYNYGPPRMKVILNLGGQPKVIAELDITAAVDKPEIYEFPAIFTTESAGVTIDYAYDVPRELENFWMQGSDEFARPELWVDWIELEGPVYPSWPLPTVNKTLGTTANINSSQQAEKVLTDFMKRAYRRPVETAEVKEKLQLYADSIKQGNSPDQSIKLALSAVLVSPHFLYLTETVTGNDKVHKLNAYQLASRLSYFLWSSMPDDELFKLAENSQLLQPAVQKQQIQRMLKDPKSRDFVRNFAGQWLSLRDVGANPPAADLYPEYDRHLEISIVKESEEFFATILDEKLPITDFLDADYVVINERLARFYGIPNVKGDQFRKVKVPQGVERGGIMTQASVLSITSNGTRTSPVKRGTWIMKTLLGTDPGLPVANAGEIAPKVPGIDKATVRQRLEIHRELPQCARCHSKIDPLGFALENYNAAGQWREQEGFGYKGRIGKNDPKIDASSKLPDGTPIVGIQGLQKALLKNQELFYGCLTRKMMTYAYGRELGLADEVHVKNIVSDLKKPGKNTLPQLIESIVLSEPFLTK